MDQPIAALASPPGRAARGIVRISGLSVGSVIADWFQPDEVERWQSPQSAEAHSGRLILNGSRGPLRIPVRAMFWPDRRSYTGQSLLELHLPGSPCLLEAVLSETFRRGVRAARPGEFTLRAFLAGKIDLLQAEAVLGVIDAQNHHELKTALAQLAGGVSGELSRLRHDLLELIADLEAGLDFVDEDIEFVSRDDVCRRLQQAIQFVDQLLQQTADRMQSHVRPRVVLAGLPNAGKSTLFNRLAGTRSALVSSEQGTTRDFLVRSVDWLGLTFDLVDTAGWEEDATGAAAAAQTQRADQLSQASVLIWCTAADLSETDRQFDEVLFQRARDRVIATIRLMTKIDLNEQKFAELNEVANVSVSSEQKIGLEALRDSLLHQIQASHRGEQQWLGMTATRCRSTLESVSASLRRANQAALSTQVGDELIAIDLREAIDQLGMILGVIYTDDILGRIFSKFCIGK